VNVPCIESIEYRSFVVCVVIGTFAVKSVDRSEYGFGLGTCALITITLKVLLCPALIDTELGEAKIFTVVSDFVSIKSDSVTISADDPNPVIRLYGKEFAA
jgi:hypothetical protein